MANRDQLDNTHPIGAPINAFLKIDAPLTGGKMDDMTISKDYKSVVLHTSSEDQKSKFQYVLDTDSSIRDVYDHSIKSTVAAPAAGYNTSVLVVGATNTSKRQTFEGLVPLALEGLATTLSQMSKQAVGSGGSMKYMCGCHYVEIIEEVVHDLLKSDNINLDIHEHAVRGIEVQGCSYAGPMTDIRELKAVFARGSGARSLGQRDFGPESKFATAIFSVDLTVFRTTPGSKSRETAKGKMIFAEIPGTESLSGEVSALAQRQGMLLNRSLMSLKNIARTLSNPQGEAADFINFEQSKLTHLLRDSLCANSGTMVVACARQGQTKESIETMDLCELLQRSETFPVCNKDFEQGLIRRMRIRAQSLRDQIVDIMEGKGIGGKDAQKNEDALRGKLESVQEGAVRDKLEIIKLREDNKTVYAKLQEFRKRYNELVNSKAGLQEQLLKSEEEKLRVSKALVDLQIENNDLVERSEADKYELVTKLLNAENDILEMEMKEQKKVQSTDDLESKIKSLTKEKKDLAMEFVTLKNNFVNLNKEYKAELAKNEELGVELLTLVNQKNAIEAEKKNISNERDGLKKANVQLRQEVAEVQAASRETENRLRMEREKTQDLTSEKAKVEMELDRNRVEFEKRGVMLEKSVTELQRERDNELMTVRKGGEVEQKRYEERQMALSKTNADLETRLRQTHRKLMEAEKQLSKALQDLSTAESNNSSLENKVKAMTDNYRSKLLEYLSEARSGGHGEEQRQSIINEMTQTYKVAEERMSRQLEESRREGHNLMLQNRAIYSQYKDIRNRLEDADPVNRGKLPPEPSREQFVATLSEKEQNYEHELNQLRERQRNLTQELNMVNEKGVQSAETFRKMLSTLEKQNAELNGDNKLLKQQKEHMEKELEIMASSGGGGGGGGGADAQTKRALKQLQSLQENLMQQMSDLRREGLPQSRSQGGGVDPTELANAREEARQLRAELKEAQARISQNISKAAGGGAVAPASGGGGDAAELITLKAQVEQERLQAEIDSLKKQVMAAQGQNVAAGKYSDDPNKRAAELMTRNAVVEEELKNYQSYMKSAQQKFTKTVKKLKTHLSFWKNKAVQAGVDPNSEPK
jgi:coiled-coil domain-containing protein 78